MGQPMIEVMQEVMKRPYEEADGRTLVILGEAAADALETERETLQLFQDINEDGRHDGIIKGIEEAIQILTNFLRWLDEHENPDP